MVVMERGRSLTRYRLKDGAPDPATLKADCAALAGMALQTLSASTARKVSPVYALLDHLREPAWRDLLLAERNEFSMAHEAWCSRTEVARLRLCHLPTLLQPGACWIRPGGSCPC